MPDSFDGLTGTVEYIRLIRSDAKLRILSHTFDMPEEVIYGYVVAVLDIPTETLTVYYHGVEVTSFPFPLKYRSAVTNGKGPGNDVLTAATNPRAETKCWHDVGQLDDTDAVQDGQN